MSIGEVSEIFGVSPRTLRYYDEIGLLKPSYVTESKYRYYDDEALASLQQILFFRSLQIPLKEIAQLMRAPAYDRLQALRMHRALLHLQRTHLDDLIRLLDHTIGGAKTVKKPHTTANDVAAAKAQYAEEVRTRWGHTAEYTASENNEARRTAEETVAAAQSMDEIFATFGASVANRTAPDDPEMQALVARWQAHISEHYYPCSKEILAGLGEMYTEDGRFSAYLNQFGQGTAEQMRDAIRVYCRS